MNTNDLPPAAKLAALIEVGRAAYPNLGHGRGNIIDGDRACAIGFACLGSGLSVPELRAMTIDHYKPYRYIRDLLPADEQVRHDLVRGVWYANDDGATLSDICQSLREGELAKVTA